MLAGSDMKVQVILFLPININGELMRVHLIYLVTINAQLLRRTNFKRIGLEATVHDA